MNQIKIGNFIADRRKSKKLTQKDIAEMLGVTNRSVSKWETGQCLPDVSLFEPLCNILGINVNELLAGEKLDKDSKERNKEVIHYIEYSKKKDRLKYLIITVIFLILAIITILGAYFLTNFNKTTVYELSGKSENFSYRGGLLIVSNYKNVFSSGKVKVENAELENSEILNVTLKSDKRTIIGGNKFFDGASLVQEDYGYKEILDKEKIDNIDNWYLEIYYVIDNDFAVEKIDVKNEIITSNNKLLTFKVGQISEDEKSSTYYDVGNYEYGFALMGYLEELGYEHKSDNSSWFGKVFANDPINNYESISVNPFTPQIIYQKRTDKKNSYSIDWVYKTPTGFNLPIIKVNGYKDDVIYSASYNVDDNSITCTSGECPDYISEYVMNFLNDYEDIINFEKM